MVFWSICERIDPLGMLNWWMTTRIIITLIETIEIRKSHRAFYYGRTTEKKVGNYNNAN